MAKAVEPRNWLLLVQIKDAPGKWKEANDSCKYHLEGQLILQFEAIVQPLYSEQIIEFGRC